MAWYIYGIREKLEGSLYRYVGYTTTSPSERLYLHLHAARTFTKPYAVYDWIRSVKYNIIAEVVEECPEGDIANLYQREIYWIGEYRTTQGSLEDRSTPGYLLNQTDGGGGAYGYKHTDEERERRRNRVGPWSGVRGPDNPNYGKKRTEEQKKTISEWQQANTKRGAAHHRYGLKASDETRRKQAKAKLGKKASESTKLRMSHTRHRKLHTEQSKETCRWCLGADLQTEIDKALDEEQRKANHME